MLRDAVPADFSAIVALNRAVEALTSPLDEAKLAELDAASAYHRVVSVDGKPLAFLLAFREGARYESTNYQWFSQRLPAFMYIDRIVVDDGLRGQGWGKRLYEDLMTVARTDGLDALVCEYNSVPANEPSAHFHRAMGFEEMGERWLIEGEKCVSYQRLRLQAPAP